MNMKKWLSLAAALLLLLAVSLGALAQERAPMTQSLMALLDADEQLRAMMEKSLAQAAAINPDPDTNPAQTLEQLYDFLDWAATCMPWNVLRDAD